MKTRFSRKIAKEIAQISFEYVLDSICGNADYDYNLSTGRHEFETNFEEDLEERNIVITDKRIEIIGSYYDQMVDKLRMQIEKKYIKPS